MMTIKILPAETHGKHFQETTLAKRAGQVLQSHNVLVLTGANGAGKSTLIDALSASAGLGGRYSSSETKYQYSRLDMRDTQDRCKGAVLVDPVDETPFQYDLILRYRGEEARVLPLSMDTTEDIQMLFSGKGSHGQVSFNRFIRIIEKTQAFLKEPKGRMLCILDEPETALGLDYLFAVSNVLAHLCQRALHNDHLHVIVATQSPFIFEAMSSVDSTRIDLGGWYQDIDPFPATISLVTTYYKNLKAQENRLQAKEAEATKKRFESK